MRALLLIAVLTRSGALGVPPVRTADTPASDRTAPFLWLPKRALPEPALPTVPAVPAWVGSGGDAPTRWASNGMRGAYLHRLDKTYSSHHHGHLPPHAAPPYAAPPLRTAVGSCAWHDLLLYLLVAIGLIVAASQLIHRIRELRATSHLLPPHDSSAWGLKASPAPAAIGMKVSPAPPIRAVSCPCGRLQMAANGIPFAEGGEGTPSGVEGIPLDKSGKWSSADAERSSGSSADEKADEKADECRLFSGSPSDRKDPTDPEAAAGSTRATLPRSLLASGVWSVQPVLARAEEEEEGAAQKKETHILSRTSSWTTPLSELQEV